MTRFLHSSINKSNTENLLSVWVRERPVRFAIIFFTIFFGQQITAQQVDTWFSAGKGINSPTSPFWLYQPDPITTLGQDGNPVNTWYDIVYYTEQNLIPNPANPADYPNDPFLGVPPGFDYPFPNSGSYALFLTPTGSIPGVPTVRRNPTDNLNFNPIVEFDGSGDGEALHFRSNSRGDVTVFVVFRALGAGNSAETQRLLFGGDVDVHHESNNSDDWTTNLSLGIANGNRFSIGRTWNGDAGGFFQSGGIDLLGEPSIGAFSRTRGVDLETLTTHVNGLRDILTNRNHPLADNTLFYFNRVGKHFNSNDSNRNLTGDIAEILLADFAMSNNQRQRIESYLALKYGITLSNGAQLGSIAGNATYNYLAADGTVIWQSDPTYQHDIAGLGKDRYKDVLNSLSLRYNIDQRISKSINSDAIVTMSTNSDFTTDNLDLSRTAIDGQISGGIDPYEHNYLIWANDNASINEVLAELPTGIDSRIEREWRVQAVRTAANPIANISVRVDLSTSDILVNNPGGCTIKLLIDTDLDGDFTTGPITEIDATNIDMAGNAYFDNVTFNHREVFTVGFVDETPNVLDLLDETVCDSYTLPAINGTNLSGNEAYYDGPGGTGTQYSPGDVLTVSGTYYIYDETGTTPNCFDEESFVLTVNVTPNIDPLADQTVCDSYTLPAISGTNLTGNEAYYDAPNGGGNQYAPGDALTASGTYYIYDEIGTTPNCSDQESFVLTVNATPDVFGLLDTEACDSFVLPAILGSDLSGNQAYYDGPGGTGTQYSPGDVLTASGTYYIYDETGTTPNCFDQESFVLTITPSPVVDAGSDEEICQGDVHDLSTSGTVPTASDAGSLLWSSAGDGSFDDATLLAPTYTPGVNDIANGSVVLTLTGNGNGSCPDVLDTMTLTIDPQPVADAGADDEICGAVPYTVVGASASGFDNVLWTHNGTGNFTDATVVNAEYNPGAGDIGNVVTLTLTASSTGLCGDAIDTMDLTIDEQPVADAGADDEICDGVPYTVTGASASGFDNVLWTHNGTGNFTDATVVNAEYNPAPGDIGNVVTLTLTASSTGLCGDAIDTMDLTIDEQPVADAGADDEICDGVPYTVTAASASGFDNVLWTHNGTGNFTDATVVNAEYNPAPGDIGNVVTLTLTASSTGLCGDAIDTMDLTITPSPVVDAGSDQTICEGNVMDLSTSATQPSESNTAALLWTTAGDGSFNDPNILLPVYTPGAADILAGSVVLTLTGNGNGTCPVTFDSMALTINDRPTIGVDLFSDPTTCAGSDGSITFIFTNVPDGNHDIVYDAGTFNAVPVNAGSAVVNGLPAGNYNNLRITVNGCTSTEDPDVTLTAPGSPDIDPLADQTVCDSYTLPAISGTDLTGNEAYYDGPGGTGTQYNPGDALTASGTYYIYDQSGTCSDEESFVLTVNVTPDVLGLLDQTVCDSYTLPAISGTNLTGNQAYYDGPGGTGTQYSPGDVLTASGTYYIYDETGTTPNCFDEESFVLTVNVTPDIDPLADQTVCDSYTLPAISGTNLTGNEAYYDAPNGGGNQYAPGDALTASGTYYIYDETGTTPNCSDQESFVLTVNATPDVFGLLDTEACDSFVLPAILGSDLSGNQAYYDGPGGTGTQYSPGDVLTASGTYYIYDETGTTPNCFDQESFVLTITPSPVVDAGSDEEICQGDVHDLSTSGTVPTASDAGSLLWSSAGDGSFDDATLLAPTYTPGVNDIANGSVVLTLTGNGNGSCPDVLDTMTLTIDPQPVADAGADDEICGAVPYTVVGASASGFDNVLWTHNGTGNFTDATVVNAEYNPGAGDIGNVVTLTLTASSTGLCGDAIDTMDLTIDEQPVADAGADDEICDGVPYTVTGASASGFDNVLWTHNGTGNFTDATVVNAEYNPAPGDIGNVVTLTLTASSTGLCGDAIDTMDLTIDEQPVADAGADDEICDGVPYTVTAASASGFDNVLWTHNGTGNFTDATVVNAEYNPAPGDIGNVVTLTLTASSTGLCGDAIDTMDLTITPSPVVDAGSDQTICEGNVMDLSTSATQPSESNTAALLWTTAGDGSFNDPNILLPVYTPGAADILAGSVVLTLTGNGNGTCPVTFDSMALTINDRPTIGVDLFSDPTTCAGSDGSITFIFTNVPDGNHDIVYDAGTFNAVPVNAGSAVVNGLPAGNYNNLRITVNGCTSTEDPDVTLTAPGSPDIDPLADQTVCDSYTLPAISGTDLTGNEAYYDGPGGTGTQYNPGDALTASGTYYIYDQSGTCSDEESFVLTVNVTPDVLGLLDQTVCDSYTLPAISGTNLTGNQAYYDGPGGTGTQYSPGDVLTASGTYYIYDETGTTPNCFDQESFVLTVNVTPDIDPLADQTVCDSYTLPAISGTNLTGNEAYYDAPNGGGNQYAPGDALTASGTYYIYDETGTTPNCSDQESFVLTVNATPDVFGLLDTEACDSFVLPAILGSDLSGNQAYYDGPGGTGTQYSPGDVLTASGTYYIYDETGTTPNCFDQESFVLTITPSPVVDAGSDEEICQGDVHDLSTSGTVPTASDAGSLLWSSAGDGSFDDATLLAPTYTPGVNDIANGSVVLTLTGNGNGSCPDVLDTMTLTIDPQPVADAGADDGICGAVPYTVVGASASGFDNVLWTHNGTGNFTDATVVNAEYNPAPGDIGNVVTLTLTASSTGLCGDAIDTMDLTIDEQPVADAPVDVEVCDSYTLPELTNGNYFTGSGGTGIPLFEGDVINTSQTIFVFSSGQGNCPDAEQSFEVTITGFSVSINVEDETCWESDNGSVSVTIGNADLPVTVQLNNMEPMVFNSNSFSIDNLSPGNYEMSVIDDTGCETNTGFSIQPGGANLGGSVDVLYSCDANLPSNTIAVTLFDPSVSNDVLYALDSTEPNDFTLSPDFGNISPGDHSLFILDNNGCMGEIPFEVENFEPLELTLTSEYVNQITANVTGGTAPYTYYFDDNSETDSNTYTITRSGTFTVRVVDSNGCEVFESTTMNLMEITIPNFFTPNNDGQNDFWKPRNTAGFPDIETYIFDRYGRKIWVIGPLDQGWDGTYESRPIPSGDYWYIVKLNDGTGREYVGNFTLYR